MVNSPETGPLTGDTAGAVEGTAVPAGGKAGAVGGASCVTQPRWVMLPRARQSKNERRALTGTIGWVPDVQYIKMRIVIFGLYELFGITNQPTRTLASSRNGAPLNCNATSRGFKQ